MHASVLFHMSVSWLWEVGWVWFNTDPTDYWYWCQDWWDRYRTVPNCEKVSAHATDVHTRRDVHNLDLNMFLFFLSICLWSVCSPKFFRSFAKWTNRLPHWMQMTQCPSFTSAASTWKIQTECISVSHRRGSSSSRWAISHTQLF